MLSAIQIIFKNWFLINIIEKSHKKMKELEQCSEYPKDILFQQQVGF